MNTRKWGCLILWIMLLTLIMAALFFRTDKVAASPITQPIVATSSTVVTVVAPSIVATTTKPIVPQILLDIAYCESGGRQFYADGKLVIGRIDHADTGKFQINKRFHAKTAKAMGLNLDTEEGNTAYALFLYKTQGTRPWNASRNCWKNIAVWKNNKRTYY